MEQHFQQQPLRLTWWALMGLLILSMGILLFPIPRVTRMDHKIGDLLHAPCFAILAAICYTGWRQLKPHWEHGVGLAVWASVSLMGLLSEWLQGFVTRSPSWHDVVANVLGVAAGVIWMHSRLCARIIVRFGLRVIAVVLIATASGEPILAICEYYEQSRDFPMLASFERHRELQHWSASDGRVSRTRGRSSHGRWSMRVDMVPARWPGAGMRPVGDWFGYDELVFDVWLAQVSGSHPDQVLDLVVKVSDEEHNGETQDRFHKTVRLVAGGKQSVRIALSEIRAAPVSREMDLGKIVQLQFFTLHPKRPQTIWLDNIHLE